MCQGSSIVIPTVGAWLTHNTFEIAGSGTHTYAQNVDAALSPTNSALVQLAAGDVIRFMINTSSEGETFIIQPTLGASGIATAVYIVLLQQLS